MMSLNIFDWHGPAFLTLYGALFVIALIASLWVERASRPEGRSGIDGNDIDALAWLAGGTTRFVDALLTRLLASGALQVVERSKMAVVRRGGNSVAEQRILNLSSPFTYITAARQIAADAEPVIERLQRRGLLLDASDMMRLRWLATLPLLALAGIGGIKLAWGLTPDRPVGFLSVFLIVTLIAVAIRWSTIDRRTSAARTAIHQRQRQHERLKRAATRDEATLGVALFGTMVLAGSSLDDFYRLRSGDSGGDSGTSGGGDGDGGCGGGCGGCGGD